MTPLPVDNRLAMSIHSEVGFCFVLQEINTRTWPRFSLILHNVCLLCAFSGKVFELSGALVIYQRQMPPSLVLQLPRRAQGDREGAVAAGGGAPSFAMKRQENNN